MLARVLAVTLLLAAACSAPRPRIAAGQPTPRERVAYELALDPGTATVSVTMRVPERAGPRVFVMPRAIPMGYGTAPYDRFVGNLAACDAAGDALRVEKAPFGPRWTIGDDTGSLRRVRYSVDVAAMERALLQAADASKVRAGYAGLLGYSVFGFVDGLEHARIDLTVRAPDDWPVFTTLAPAERPALGAVACEAADFYALADSQLIFGKDVTVLRKGSTPPLFLACYAECEVDHATLLDLAREALDALVEFFDSAPFPHYTVHVEFLRPLTPAHEYGFSMEHLDSTTLFLATSSAITEDSSQRQRERTLYNLTHHVAHAWIPKRCAMKGYFPFTWEVAPVLDSIWFSEGFGQWAAMEAIARRRADPAAYRRRILDRRFRRTVQLMPRYLKDRSLVEVSRLASTQYSSNFATGTAVFSRGALLAEAIDQAVRRATDGGKSLRDGLAELVAHAATKTEPVTVDDLVAAVRRTSGVDVRAEVRKGLAPLR